MNKALITRDISMSANATHAVRKAVEDGIYTMAISAQLTTAPDVIDMYDAAAAAIKKLQVFHMAMAIRPALASTTPSARHVVLIIYDSRKKNPYMSYNFTHNTMIVRDSWRLLEQTVQLIHDAQLHRSDLDDMILHTCVTEQHGDRKYMVVIGRGRDDYKRSFYKGKKKQPVHEKEKNEEPLPKDLEDDYMVEMLQKHGNTVVDRRFIRKLGAEKTAQYLSEEVGEAVFLRLTEGDTPRDTYYIAETEKRRRRT